MVEIRNLWRRFGNQQVLAGVNLKIPEGKTTVILGGSGQGKSVLLKHIIGLLLPDEGDILVAGEEVTRLPEKQKNRVRKNFGMLFQDAALFDSMNVFDNVAFPLHEHADMEEREVKERVLRVLGHVDLHNVESKWPSELSGGMRKRVGLARALIHEPEIILYDEPTTGLDPITSGHINRLINATKERLGITSLVISHDLTSTKEVADRIAMLSGGKIIESDDAATFFKSANPLVQGFLKGRSQSTENQEVN